MLREWGRKGNGIHSNVKPEGSYLGDKNGSQVWRSRVEEQSELEYLHGIIKSITCVLTLKGNLKIES